MKTQANIAGVTGNKRKYLHFKIDGDTILIYADNTKRGRVVTLQEMNDECTMDYIEPFKRPNFSYSIPLEDFIN